MKIIILALCLFSSAFAAERSSYLFPSYTSSKNFSRLGIDGRMAVGPAIALHAKFFRSVTEVTGSNDLNAWEARVGASYLTSNAYLFQLLGIYRDEPGPVKAQGLAPTINVPINQYLGIQLSTIAGLDIEFLKYTGLSNGSTLLPDQMMQTMLGPSVRQELVDKKLFVTVGHDEYFYDEDSLTARSRLNSRYAAFANSGAILLGLPDNTSYTRLDAYPLEMLSVSPRISTSKSLEVDNRTLVMAVNTWLKLPMFSVGLDIGTQKTKNVGTRQNFVGLTFAL